MAKYYYLARVKSVKRPRKDWPRRWFEAGKAVEWKGVFFKHDKNGKITEDMIAERDSPIWKALAQGAGGFRDAFGKGKPPFAYGSGMGWIAKPLAETESRKLEDIKGLGKTENESIVHDRVLVALGNVRKALPKVIKLELKV